MFFLQVGRHSPVAELAVPLSHSSAPSTLPLPQAPDGLQAAQLSNVQASAAVGGRQLLVRVCGKPPAVTAQRAHFWPAPQSESRTHACVAPEIVALSARVAPVSMQTPEAVRWSPSQSSVPLVSRS